MFVRCVFALSAFGMLALVGSGQPAAKAPSAKDIKAVADKAVAYLKSTQQADGSFSPGFTAPGITSLVAAALLKDGYSPKDPVVAKSLKFLETKVKKDGGIYDKALANYITSVAVMAFSEANEGGKYDSVLKNAADFLKGIQHDGGDSDPLHGGFDYNGPGNKADLSNTGFSLDALIAAGLSKDDPAVKKALTFVKRTQNFSGEEGNDQPWAAKASADDKGGFVYNPSAKGGRDATAAGGLRSLGAMTYTGLKSFLYAGVKKDDPRVKAAVGWIRRHYTLDENPGMGKAGLYYYYNTFGKAMTALGEDPFTDAKGTKHEWKADLFMAIKSRQDKDGSFQNSGDRTFGESDRNLATSFALLSLSYCKAK
jgi:squalene-hopene/tetraprenyl-beta-curcumene cyclase